LGGRQGTSFPPSLPPSLLTARGEPVLFLPFPLLSGSETPVSKEQPSAVGPLVR
jgi:hypothetical protein